MKEVSQGDVVKLSGFRNLFLVASKNAFIRSTGMFHVCPALAQSHPGPVHIPITLLNEKRSLVAICEQIKMIDPNERGVGVVDHISYRDIMEVSDTIQGIYEYN